jgi:putative endonuclease
VAAAVDTWFVYVALCGDGTFYTGIARDVAQRIALHNTGRGARYTRGRGPITVHALKRCSSKGEALRLELAVKRLAAPEKRALSSARRFNTLARRISAAREATVG